MATDKLLPIVISAKKFSANSKLENVEVVLFTGGLANGKHIVDWIRGHGAIAYWVGGLPPYSIYDGSSVTEIVGRDEQLALLTGTSALVGDYIVRDNANTFRALSPKQFSEDHFMA